MSSVERWIATITGSCRPTHPSTLNPSVFKFLVFFSRAFSFHEFLPVFPLCHTVQPTRCTFPSRQGSCFMDIGFKVEQCQKWQGKKGVVDFVFSESMRNRDVWVCKRVCQTRWAGFTDKRINQALDIYCILRTRQWLCLSSCLKLP